MRHLSVWQLTVASRLRIRTLIEGAGFVKAHGRGLDPTMLRQPSLKPVSLNKGFSFGCRPCLKSLSGFGWHGVTGGSRRGGCPAVRCRPVCTTLLRSGLRRDAHRRCNAQWVERRWGTCGSVYSEDFGSRALADAGISGKSGSGSSCLNSRPSTETSLGSILGMRLSSLRWT